MAKYILTYRVFPDVNSTPRFTEVEAEPERGRVLSYDEIQRSRRMAMVSVEGPKAESAVLVHHIVVR